MADASNRASPPGAEDLSRALAAVFARPDDDAPREQFAMLLDRAGDPRGDFIRLQLADARAPDRDRADRRGARPRKTWPGKYPRAWLGAVGGRALDVTYHRGFPVAVVMKAAPFIELFHDVLRVGPQLTANVRFARPRDVPELAALELGRLHGLVLEEAGLLDEDIAALAPRFAGLRTLGLSANGRRVAGAFRPLTDAALHAIARHADALDALYIDQAALTGAGVDRILATWPRLQQLRIGRSAAGELTDRDVRRLFDGLPALRSFHVYEPQLSRALRDELQAAARARAR